MSEWRERERERSDHEDKLIMLEGHKILSILVKLKDIRLDLFYLLNNNRKDGHDGVETFMIYT